MGSDPHAGNELDRILRLADGCDPTSLPLTPEEGFLLSRIDGHTSWRLLRQISGVDEDEVDLVLESWLATGIVEVSGHAAAPKQDRVAARARDVVLEKRAKGAGDEAIDSSLDLDPDIQRRILEFEKNLDRPDLEIIGVDEGSGTKAIKKAYFKLSKEFHPDRYFRREIGDYKGRLDRIFKRVLDAYENLTAADAVQEAAAEAQGHGEATAPPKAPTKLDRLKQRMPFKMPDSVPEERQQQAHIIFQGATTSERLGRVGEALANVRIALSFDPYNTEYRTKLRELELRHADMRVEELLGDLSPAQLRSLDPSELDEAAELLECILAQRPLDAEATRKAAELAIERASTDEALEYAQTLLEQGPEVAAAHRTLGLVHQARSEIGHAKKAFERALELDPQDSRAKKSLATMRVGRAVA